MGFQFTDSLKRCWLINITAQVIINFQRELSFNVFEAFEPEIFQKFFANPAMLLKMLWISVRKSTKISEEEFYESIDGDVLEEAQECLIHAIIESFPKKKRAVLHKLWQENREEETKKLDEILNENISNS